MDEGPVSPPGGDEEDFAYLLVQLGLLLARQFGERLAPFGLEPRHAGMLTRLAAHQGLSQQALGELIGPQCNPALTGPHTAPARPDNPGQHQHRDCPEQPHTPRSHTVTQSPAPRAVGTWPAFESSFRYRSVVISGRSERREFSPRRLPSSVLDETRRARP